MEHFITTYLKEIAGVVTALLIFGGKLLNFFRREAGNVITQKSGHNSTNTIIGGDQDNATKRRKK